MSARSSPLSGPGFMRIEAGIPIFPMSWKRAPSSSRLSRAPLEAELAADLDRHVADPARVRRRVRVLRLERVRERLDRREERPLERREAPRVRDREPCLARDPGEQLELAAGDVRLDLDRERGEAVVDRDEGHGVGRGEVARVERASEDGRVAGAEDERLAALRAPRDDRRRDAPALERRVGTRRRRSRDRSARRPASAARPSSAATP